MYKKQIAQSRYYIRVSLFPVLYNQIYLYYTLIYIVCCNCTWSSTHVSNLNTIYYLQKRAVRAITNSDYRAHSAPLFSKLVILDIFKVNTLEIAKVMFYYRNNSASIASQSFCITMVPEQPVIIERICAVQISSNLQFFTKVLKFGTLFLFQSLVRQTFLVLRRKCKSFYLNNH